MRLLLDTHTLLWISGNSPRLSSNARLALSQAVIPPVYSIVSLWEISIKVSQGKLDLGRPLEDFIQSLEANSHFDRWIILPRMPTPLPPPRSF